MFLRELPFGELDVYHGQPRQWNFYAISDAHGACQVESFLDGLRGKLARTGEDMLAFLDAMVFEREGPRRWIGTARCHESVANERIFEFIIGDLRVHWFYGDGRAVVILAVAALKRSSDTPRKLKSELKALRDGYMKAAKDRSLTILQA